MRLTNIPKLYYGNETYGYGNLLELFPCLEAQASPYLGEAKSPGNNGNRVAVSEFWTDDFVIWWLCDSFENDRVCIDTRASSS